MLIRDEGRQLRPYLDCCGKYWRDCTCAVKGNLTIGVGRNLDSNGISGKECNFLLSEDIAEKTQEVSTKLPWAGTLDDARFGVLINMAFNMGVDGLLEFKGMLGAMRAGQWDSAASHLLDSLYATQVGDRAKRLAKQLQTGVWQ